MLEVKNLTKIYKPKKGKPVIALDNVSITFEERGMVFILGRSGSGKSTLLNLMGGLDSITSGAVIVKGRSSKDFNQSDFDSYRNTFIGFVFQEYNILNEFTVGQNIALALELQGKKANQEEIDNILDQVDLVGYANRKPMELSGGQKQRVAIARALIKDPEIIMADEPTGALDSNTGRQVFETLQKLSKEKLVIIISHDREYAEFYGDRVIEFADGKILSDIKKYTAQSVSVTDNISVIDNTILHVKKGKKLTETEKNKILQFLDNDDNDLIISKSSKSNRDFRKQSRIDEEGNKDSFEKTELKNLDIKEYNAKDFKMIKSALPFRHSVRMGASGLKIKPVRLVMTILLSAIAFALFGLVDTLGAYDKYLTAYNSIIEQNINYATFSKGINHYLDSDYKYFENTRMNDEDVVEIESKFSNYKFDKVYSFNSSSIGNLFNYPNYQYYVYQYSGYIISDAATITTKGYSITGTYPANENEIAITSYMAESFVDYKYRDYNTGNKVEINNISDMVGKILNIDNQNFKITAIIDTNFNGFRYEKFKIAYPSSIDEYLLYSELEAVKSFSYHTLCFFNNDYQEKQQDIVYSYAKNESFYENNDSIYYIDYLGFFNKKDDNSYFFDKNKTTLDSNEILIDFNDFINYTNYKISENIHIDISLSTYDYFESRYNESLHSIQMTNLLINRYISHGYTEEEAHISLDYFLESSSLLEAYMNMIPEDTTIFGKSHNEVNNEIMLEKILEDIKNQFGASIDFIFKTNQRVITKDYYGYEMVDYPMKIVGLVNIPDIYGSPVLIFNKGQYKTMFGETGNIAYIITDFKQNKAQDMELIKFSYEENDNIKYTLQNAVTSSLNNINSMIERLAKIFLYIGIGFAIFSALLLLNFISTSISYKKREIGILRAVGARSKDVFSIFFSESFIIACISFVIAFTVAVVACNIINKQIALQLGLSILNLTIRQFIIMFIISVVTAFISSFLPVYKIASKHPVETIRTS